MAQNAPRTPRVFRFDYERPGHGIFYCYIAGYSIEECDSYLMGLYPDAQISQRSQEYAIHAITDEFRQVIVESSQPEKRKPGRPKGTTK